METDNNLGKWVTYAMVVRSAKRKDNTGKVHREGQGGGGGDGHTEGVQGYPCSEGDKRVHPGGTRQTSGESLACSWNWGEVGQVRGRPVGRGVRDTGCQPGLQREWQLLTGLKDALYPMRWKLRTWTGKQMQFCVLAPTL